jgi:ribosomal-protein-alanine N-acetyltransferase
LAIGEKIRRMQLEDLDEIMAIEQVSFPTPWARQSYEGELYNELSCYLVSEHEGRVTGYVGTWFIFDEAHITNVAVHPEFRGRRLAEELLTTLEIIAVGRGVRKMTLEVRPSNISALRLYRRLKYLPIGLRKGYYIDNGEDALIMAKNLF